MGGLERISMGAIGDGEKKKKVLPFCFFNRGKGGFLGGGVFLAPWGEKFFFFLVLNPPGGFLYFSGEKKNCLPKKVGLPWVFLGKKKPLSGGD